MAVFRVERNTGYTVMSNHHLRNKELSLKAKGLLSQMLSLPEDWDYTLAGLSYINRESIDAIRTAGATPELFLRRGEGTQRRWILPIVSCIPYSNRLQGQELRLIALCISFPSSS